MKPTRNSPAIPPCPNGVAPSQREIVPPTRSRDGSLFGIRSQLNREPPPNYRPPLQGSDEVSRNPAATSRQLSLLSRDADEAIKGSTTESNRRERVTLIGDLHAIQLEPGTSGRGGYRTVFIRAAPLTASEQGARTIDWSQSLILSLAPYELGLLLSVLSGGGRCCRLIGHGAQHDIWMQALFVPEGMIRITVGQGTSIRTADITHRQFLQALMMVEGAARSSLGISALPTEAHLRQLQTLYGAAQRVRAATIRDKDIPSPVAHAPRGR
jgi:hypothetical protein